MNLSGISSFQLGAKRRDQAKETDLGGRSKEGAAARRIDAVRITGGVRKEGLLRTVGDGARFEAT